MRIGINLLPYRLGEQGGAGVYMYNLLLALANNHPENDYFLISDKYNTDQFVYGSGIQEEIVSINGRSQVVRGIAEQLILPRLEQKLELDVLFSNYVIPFSLRGGARIVNIHDMLVKVYPELYPSMRRNWLQWALKQSIKRADVVLTVSNASQADILKYYPNSSQKIFVQSEGVDVRLKTISNSQDEIKAILTKLEISSPFILSSATFGKHKNIPQLLKAFQIIRQKYPDLMLTLTGKPGEFANTISSELLENVVLTGFVDYSELAALYSSAIIYVLPSLYEGFGLSILEAQYFNCPVTTSNFGATKEVGGSGAVLFDPLNEENIATKLIELLENENKRLELIDKGKMNLQRYSWELAAKQFIDACYIAIDKRGKRGS